MQNSCHTLDLMQVRLTDRRRLVPKRKQEEDETDPLSKGGTGTALQANDITSEIKLTINDQIAIWKAMALWMSED